MDTAVDGITGAGAGSQRTTGAAARGGHLSEPPLPCTFGWPRPRSPHLLFVAASADAMDVDDACTPWMRNEAVDVDVACSAGDECRSRSMSLIDFSREAYITEVAMWHYFWSCQVCTSWSLLHGG